MGIVNATPQDVVIYDDDGNVVKTYPRSGMVASVAVTSKVVDNVNGVDVAEPSFGGVVGIPEPSDGTIYIVPLMVVAHVSRSDLIGPDTGTDSVVRDDHGRILGVKRFTR